MHVTVNLQIPVAASFLGVGPSRFRMQQDEARRGPAFGLEKSRTVSVRSWFLSIVSVILGVGRARRIAIVRIAKYPF